MKIKCAPTELFIICFHKFGFNASFIDFFMMCKYIS